METVFLPDTKARSAKERDKWVFLIKLRRKESMGQGAHCEVGEGPHAEKSRADWQAKQRSK